MDRDVLKDAVFNEILEKLNIKELYNNGEIDIAFSNYIYDECDNVVCDYESSLDDMVNDIETDFEKELMEIWSKQ